MKVSINIRLCIFIFFTGIIFSNCARTSIRQFEFSLNNTVSIFLLENEAGTFFCIPIQYLGDYHIGCFNFINGLIVIGGYEIPLTRDDIHIFVYLNQESDASGSLSSGHDLVFLKKNGNVSISKMNEPLSIQQIEDTARYIHYYIIIEKFLADDEQKRIKDEYKRGNIYSRFEVWFNLIINGEPQNESGVTDNFELYNGPVSDAVFLFPNLNFFRVKYL